MPKRALVVIDVQNEYVNGNLRIEYPEVSQSIGNIGMAMDAALASGVLIVVVQTVAPSGSPIFAAGSSGADLHSEVARRGRDHFVLKALPSSFAGTDLGSWLKDREVETLVVCGFMTHNCDFATASDAVHAGYSVEFLADASGSVPYANRAGSASAEELHRGFCVVMQSRFASVLATSEWIAGLASGQMPGGDSIYCSNQRAVRRG